MTNEWPHARTYASSAAVDQSPSIFPTASTDRYGMNAITKQCACAVCTSSTSNRPPTWSNTYHQYWETRPSGGTYTNQGQIIGNPVGASVTAPVLAQTQFTAPGPGARDQNNTDPLQAAAVDTPQTLAIQPVQPAQDPTIRRSVAEGFRRLADRYVNNPNSVVGVVRLEPGPSGGFQVVIILEVADL